MVDACDDENDDITKERYEQMLKDSKKVNRTKRTGTAVGKPKKEVNAKKLKKKRKQSKFDLNKAAFWRKRKRSSLKEKYELVSLRCRVGCCAMTINTSNNSSFFFDTNTSPRATRRTTTETKANRVTRVTFRTTAKSIVNQ
jgi:hypothetical protein